MGIFRQLRERRLFQIAISYAGVGWAVLEVTDQLADRGVLPQSELLYRLVLIWFLIGIPASLLIGWHHGEKGKQRAPASEIGVLAVLAIFALGMSASAVGRVRSSAQLAAAQENPLDLRRIVVTYFRDDSPNSEYQYLADGITEDLIAELTQVQGLSVVSRNGSVQFRGLDVSPDSVARALRAGTVVEGSVERRGKRLRVHINLLEGQSGAAFGRVAFDLNSADELVLRDSVTEQTGRLLRSHLGDEVRMQRSAAGTRNTAAWALLQRAEKLRKDAEAAVREHDMESATVLFGRADSLLVDAEQLDRDWAEPSIARAVIWYRQSRLAASSPAQAVPLIEAGLTHASEALSRSKTAARAYELRGTLRYFRWLMKVEPDAKAQEALLQDARADLETAVKYDPLLASAHATLSHLQINLDDVSSAVLAAQKAYEADMYLEVADLVLWRLFEGSIGLGNFSKAKSWCDEGVKRFPADSRLVACPLYLMITPSVELPDVDSAWAVAARAAALAPSARAEAERVQNEMLVAAVIARTARMRQSPTLTDSARTVLRRAAAAAGPGVDPTRQLLKVEAYVWMLLGEKDRAVAALYQHAAADPHAYERTRGESSWWFRDLEDQPRYRQLIGLN
jgi:TolB-like protein/tetratricopeptide (TPR) repeat protein